MKPDRRLCHIPEYGFFGPECAQRSLLSLLSFLNSLTNRNIASVYLEQKQKRIVHGQRDSNINFGTVVFNFGVCRLS